MDLRRSPGARATVGEGHEGRPDGGGGHTPGSLHALPSARNGQGGVRLRTQLLGLVFVVAAPLLSLLGLALYRNAQDDIGARSWLPWTGLLWFNARFTNIVLADTTGRVVCSQPAAAALR